MQVHSGLYYGKRENMKFCKLIKYDVVNGIWRKGGRYLILAFLCIIIFADFYRKALFVNSLPGNGKEATIINFLFYFFEGKEPFTPSPDNKFVFPAVWLIIFLYAAYVTLDYPFQNLTEHGTQVIFRIGSRRMWWFSKCFWVALSTLLYFSILYIVIFILCIVFHIDVTLGFSDKINMNAMCLSFQNPASAGQVAMMVYVLPLMTALAVNFIQLCMGLFVKKIYTFLISALLLFSSTYFQTPVAVGNFAMIKRSTFYQNGGMTIEQGMIVNSLLVIAMIIIGYLRIRKYDIIKKEEGEMS